MQNSSFFDKAIRFIVHNSFLTTVTFMCFVHAVLLSVMLFAGVRPLFFFNILSVVIYLFCILLCRFGHIMPVYVSILIEVTVYTAISIYYIGWDGGSCCFLCSIVPIIIYFGCFLFQGNKRVIIVGLLVANFLAYVLLYVNFAYASPVYEISRNTRTALIIFSSFVMVFSMIFYNAIYIYASEHERSSLESKNKQLTADAREDVLTGLLNRRGFLPLVEEEMKDKLPGNFCIAFCDIDNFKRINDSYGHDCGDEVLRHITRMIRREMHGSSICRWGGEEIIILMKGYDKAAAKVKAETLRRSIEETPTVFFNKRIYGTITIGLAEYSEKYGEPEQIIKAADQRMYYGKQHGKNILIYEDAEE